MIKKIWKEGLVFSLCMMMLLTFTVKASEVTSGAEIVAEGELKEEDYAVENQRLIELGSSVSSDLRASSQKVLSIPRLAQGDSAWGSVKMKVDDLTIASAGCYLTSFTMVQRYYGGTLDPAGVNTVMGNYACPFYREIAASRFGYTITSYMDSGLTESNILNYVKGAITENVPVIIAFNKPGGGNHFVVAKGYMNNVIVISDPGPQNYTSLAQYFNDGYTLKSVVCFKK
ncbi:MAG: C39 family peptidase [Clostridium sp.]|nr:C39 family peptidase [Clostridium sp.]